MTFLRSGSSLIKTIQEQMVRSDQNLAFTFVLDRDNPFGAWRQTKRVDGHFGREGLYIYNRQQHQWWHITENNSGRVQPDDVPKECRTWALILT